MKIKTLITLLITILMPTAFLAFTSTTGSTELPLQEDKRLTTLENPSANQKGKILKLSPASEKAKKNPKVRLNPTVAELRDSHLPLRLRSGTISSSQCSLPTQITWYLLTCIQVVSPPVQCKPEVHSKMSEKKTQVERDLHNVNSGPPFHQEAFIQFSKGNPNVSPLLWQTFRKSSLQNSKKSRKRACFWKYCVQKK